MYVVTTDPSADTPDAVRAASAEPYIFRTNPFSDIEEAHPKIAQAITKGTSGRRYARCHIAFDNACAHFKE